MKLSLVIKKHAWGLGLSTKGKYTVPPHDPKDGKTYVSPVRGLFAEDFETNYVVRFTTSSSVVLPKHEGVYQLELRDDSSLWVDERDEVKLPTIRIKTEEQPKFKKIADLKPLEPKSNGDASAFEEIK